MSNCDSMSLNNVGICMKLIQKLEMLDGLEEVIQSWVIPERYCVEALKDGHDADELREAYKADRRDLRKVYKLIKDNKLKKAINVGYDLDTEMRELIPDDVWEYLLTHGDVNCQAKENMEGFIVEIEKLIVKYNISWEVFQSISKIIRKER